MVWIEEDDEWDIDEGIGGKVQRTEREKRTRYIGLAA